MGYFTWTLANRKLQQNKNGDYKRSCLLPYGGYGAIVCPDSTMIKENCYDGYGIFDGKDVYDLVVDWNRDFLTQIPKTPGFQDWPIIDQRRKDLAAAYEKRDDEKVQAIIADISKEIPWYKDDWKRELGIWISCENNDRIPFPIKIVDRHRPVAYDSLPPSISTQ